MIDFEKTLQNAIKKNFPIFTIDGCFFHYSKLLWTKAKSIGLCKKDSLKKTKILIFILKLLPFMNPDDKEPLFNKMEKYFKLHEDQYQKMISYYKKNWLNNEYIEYYNLSENEYISRTNNYLEAFHSTLNNSLDCYDPKISFLITKYKEYLLKIYDKIKSSLVNKVNYSNKKFSVINDILLFIQNFNRKYKTKLDFNIILQSDEED